MIKKSINDRIADLKHDFVTHGMSVVRVKRDLAQELLLQNTDVVIKGEVRHFYIRAVGLGIFAVSLDTNSPPNQNNRMSKSSLI